MTNTELLVKKINESGKKVGYLAEKCGLSLGGFYNCRNNKAEWKARHINILTRELNLTVDEQQAIFFAKVDA